MPGVEARWMSGIYLYRGTQESGYSHPQQPFPTCVGCGAHGALDRLRNGLSSGAGSCAGDVGGLRGGAGRYLSAFLPGAGARASSKLRSFDRPLLGLCIGDLECNKVPGTGNKCVATVSRLCSELEALHGRSGSVGPFNPRP